VVEGVSPAMEEAAQTLRSYRRKNFAAFYIPSWTTGHANDFRLVGV
jgi:hypothetical protein